MTNAGNGKPEHNFLVKCNTFAQSAAEFAKTEYGKKPKNRFPPHVIG